MERQYGIPVGTPEHASRVESRSLSNQRAAPSVERHHLEFEPPAPWQLHAGEQTHPAVGLVGIHRPAVDHVSHCAVVWILSQAVHADPAHPPIDPAPRLPQQIAVVPTGTSADLADRGESASRRHVDHAGPRIDFPVDAGGFIDGGAECRVERHRLDRERVARSVGAHHRSVPEPFHQRAADPGLRRRDQRQPHSRKARRQNGHRQEQSAQATQPCIAAHDVAVRHHLGTADLEGLPAGDRDIERRVQIRDDVADRDGLRLRLDPSWTDHDRQPLDQRPHDLERQAAGANHDRRPEFDHRHATRAEGVSSLGSAP